MRLEHFGHPAHLPLAGLPSEKRRRDAMRVNVSELLIRPTIDVAPL